MARCRRRRRRRRRNRINNRRRDRISDLPDEILQHILSFLSSTKERVRKTSILSRRWRHLWTHHPSISLVLDDDVDSDDDEQDDYVHVVNACLNSCKVLVNLECLTLDLWLPISCSPSEAHDNALTADQWLRFASDRSVRTLCLAVKPYPAPWDRCRSEIPSSIFLCRALTDLAVYYGAIPALPSDFISFRDLKSFTLGYMDITDETLAGILSGCPLLESLEITGCSNLHRVELSSANLKNLLLMSRDDSAFLVTVDAPNLEYIQFRGDLRQLDFKGSTAQLQAASLNRKFHWSSFDKQDDWLKIIIAISGVRELTVNDWFYQFAIPNKVTFKNLKVLTCGVNWITGSLLHALVSMIRQCPLLEKIHINFCRHTRSRMKERYLRLNAENRSKLTNLQDAKTRLKTMENNYDNSGLDPPEEILELRHSLCRLRAEYRNFLLTAVENNYETDGFIIPERFWEPRHPLCHLRTARLMGFMGSANEMCLVKFLLGSAVSLKKFIVVDDFLRDEGRTEEEFQLLFASMPRASSQVEIGGLNLVFNNPRDMVSYIRTR